MLYSIAEPSMTTDLSRLGFASTTRDVLEGVDLTGQRILVTGADGFLGRSVVAALASVVTKVIQAMVR